MGYYIPHAIELIRANRFLSDEEKGNYIAFCRDQQNGKKATMNDMDNALQTRVLHQLEREAKCGPTTTQDIDQTSSSKESNSLQFSSLSINTDVFLYTKEISASRHKH